MPCYDARYDEHDNSEDIARLNKATRVACELAKVVYTIPFMECHLSEETRKWVKEHNALDEKRK